MQDLVAMVLPLRRFIVGNTSSPTLFTLIAALMSLSTQRFSASSQYWRILQSVNVFVSAVMDVLLFLQNKAVIHPASTHSYSSHTSEAVGVRLLLSKLNNCKGINIVNSDSAIYRTPKFSIISIIFEFYDYSNKCFHDFDFLATIIPTFIKW